MCDRINSEMNLKMDEEKVIHMFLNYTLLHLMKQIVLEMPSNRELINEKEGAFKNKELFEKTLKKLESCEVKTDSQVLKSYESFYNKTFVDTSKCQNQTVSYEDGGMARLCYEICKNYPSEFKTTSDYNKKLLEQYPLHDRNLHPFRNDMLGATYDSSFFLTRHIDTMLEKEYIDSDISHDSFEARYRNEDLLEQLESNIDTLMYSDVWDYDNNIDYFDKECEAKRKVIMRAQINDRQRREFEELENSYVANKTPKSEEEINKEIQKKEEEKASKEIEKEKEEKVTEKEPVHKVNKSIKKRKPTYKTKSRSKMRTFSFKKILSFILIPFVFIGKLFEKCFVGIKNIIVEICEKIDVKSLLLSILPTILMITYMILSSKGILNKIDFSKNVFHLTFFGYHFSAWNLVNEWLKAIDFTPFLIILLGIIILALLLIAFVIDLAVHAIMLVMGIILYLLIALLIFIWNYLLALIIPVWLFILIIKDDENKGLNIICFIVSLITCIIYYML